MDRFLHLNLPKMNCKASSILLAFCFFLGHFLGVCFSFGASDSHFSMMRAAAFCHVSIPGLLSAVVLPFLFSAAAVYLKRSVFLLPIAFLKAFAFSFLGMGVLRCFGSAGWLIRFLLMFSDCCTLPVLYRFWLHHLTAGKSSHSDFVITFMVLLLIGAVDYCFIAPFLANILTI